MTRRSPTDRQTRPERHVRWRRALLVALGAALAAHLLVLGLAVVPGPEARRPGGAIVVVPLPESRPAARRSPRGPAVRPTEVEPRRQAAGRRPRGSRSEGVPAIPHESGAAPLDRTIAPNARLELREPLQPLVATETGVRRRVASSDERRLATIRAESLVSARIADLPGVGRPTEPRTIALANGGLSLAIPWQGFVRRDRTDAAWRRERCDKGDGGADKPGEAAARRAQCAR